MTGEQEATHYLSPHMAGLGKYNTHYLSPDVAGLGKYNTHYLSPDMAGLGKYNTLPFNLLENAAATHTVGWMREQEATYKPLPDSTKNCAIHTEVRVRVRVRVRVILTPTNLLYAALLRQQQTHMVGGMGEQEATYMCNSHRSQAPALCCSSAAASSWPPSVHGCVLQTPTLVGPPYTAGWTLAPSALVRRPPGREEGGRGEGGSERRKEGGREGGRERGREGGVKRRGRERGGLHSC